MQLCDLNKGQSGEVVGLGLKGQHLKRMVELGFVKGTLVKIEAIAPKKRTILVGIRGYTLALSEDICKNVFVEAVK